MAMRDAKGAYSVADFIIITESDFFWNLLFRTYTIQVA